MLKSELRKIYISKRKNLSQYEIKTLSEKIIENFILQFNISENQLIHCFLPISKHNEVDTFLLIEYCFQNNIRVFVPKVFGNEMKSIEITRSTEFISHKWGILEPKNDIFSDEKYFDYVVTPLLYSDDKGNRVGYGKGFYDAFFRQIDTKSKRVGFNFFPPNERIIDLWADDMPLHYLVLPTEVLSFSSPLLF